MEKFMYNGMSSALLQKVMKEYKSNPKPKKKPKGLSPARLGVYDGISSVNLNRIFPKADYPRKKSKPKKKPKGLSPARLGVYDGISSVNLNRIFPKADYPRKKSKPKLNIKKLNNIYKTKNRKGIKNRNSTIRNRFKIHNVTGDGNCLFRAIAQSLNNLKTKKLLLLDDELLKANKLRKIAIKEICKQNGNTKPNKNSPLTYKQSILTELKYEYGYTKPNAFSTYCMCQSGKRNVYNPHCSPQKVFKWGGFNEITALSKLLKIKIIVYVKNSKDSYDKIVINTLNITKQKPIYIMLVGDNHYKSLFPKNN